MTGEPGEITADSRLESRSCVHLARIVAIFVCRRVAYYLLKGRTLRMQRVKIALLMNNAAGSSLLASLSPSFLAA